MTNEGREKRSQKTGGREQKEGGRRQEVEEKMRNDRCRKDKKGVRRQEAEIRSQETIWSDLICHALMLEF